MRITIKLLLLIFPYQLVYAGYLDTLYQEALIADPRLNIAQSQSAVAETRLDQANSQLLPQINFNASWTKNQRELTHSGQQDNYDGERYNLVLQQQLLNASRWHNSDRHEYLVESSKFRQSEVYADVAYDLLSKYMSALAAQDELVLTVSEREAIAKQLELLKERYKRQLATIPEVFQVEARLDGVKANEILAKAKVKIALENLSELVGRPVDGPLPELREDIPNLAKPEPLEELIEQSFSNNPTLKALDYEVKAAASGIREAQSGHYPTVDFSLTAQRSNIGFENAQSTDTTTYVAALNLSVPLYQGGGVSAKKNEQRELFNIAQHEYVQHKRQIQRAVREAYLNTEASFLRMAAAKKAVFSAEKSYQAQVKGFEYNTVTVVDVLDALRDKNSYFRDFRQSQYDFILNWTQLKNSTGAFNDEHILLIDSWESASLSK